MSLLDLAKDPETTSEQFQEAANKLKVETGYDVWLRMGQVRGSDDMVKLQPSNQKLGKGDGNQDRDSYILKLIKQGGNQLGQGQSNDDSMDFDQSMGASGFNGLSQSTEKWNPLTYAIYAGNLDLIKYIVSKCGGNTKRMVKIPGLFKSQEVSRLFPFIMSMRYSNIEMFKFFWEELSYVYCTEDTFESLFRLLARKEKPELISYLLSTQSTMTLFLSMSYSYRLEFIDHILQIKADILKELSQQVIQDQHQNLSSGGLTGRNQMSASPNRNLDSSAPRQRQQKSSS